MSKPVKNKMIRGECIGEGTYGKVYREGDCITKVYKSFSNHPLPQSILREIGFYEYFSERGSTLIPKLLSFSKEGKIWEMNIEWGGIEIHKVDWSSNEEKYKAIHLLITSLVELQVNEKILHRDLKPQNILWNGETIKIIDWGLSICSSVRTRKRYTEEVQTLHWRAPEILLYDKGPDDYNSKIDVWSIGIIIFNLLTGIRFPGDCEVDQLFKYFRVFGTPTKDFAPFLKKRRQFIDNFPVWSPRDLSCYYDIIEAVGPGFYDLLINNILVLDPTDRISPEHLKEHPLVMRWLNMYPAFSSVEANHVPLPFPSSLTSVTFKMYQILADWLLETCFKFRFDFTSLALCLAIIHKCLILKPNTIRTNFQLVGISSLFIASNWCETWAPEIKDLCYVCDNAYTKEEIGHEICSIFCSGISIFRCHNNLPITFFCKHYKENSIHSRKAFLLLFRDMIYRQGHFGDDPLWLVKKAVRIAKGDEEDPHPFQPLNRPSLTALKKCLKCPSRFSKMIGYSSLDIGDDISPLFADFCV